MFILFYNVDQSISHAILEILIFSISSKTNHDLHWDILIKKKSRV